MKRIFFLYGAIFLFLMAQWGIERNFHSETNSLVDYIKRLPRNATAEPPILSAKSFSGGLAEVLINTASSPTRVYIDLNGAIRKPLHDASVMLVKDFSEGLTPVRTCEKYVYRSQTYCYPTYWEYVDKNGNVVIDLRQTNIKAIGEISPFFDEAIRSWPNGSNKYPIDTSYTSITGAKNFSEGLAVVEVQEKKISDVISVIGNTTYGYIDRSGQFIIQPHLQNAEAFSEGLAVVQDKELKWHYIDKTGKVLFNTPFEIIKKFSEGLAPVKFKNKWGYIDKKGAIAITPQFANAEPFSNSLALISTISPATFPRWNGESELRPLGFIDHTGKIAINLQLRNLQN